MRRGTGGRYDAGAMKRRRPRSITPGQATEIPLLPGKLPARLLERFLGETVLVDPTVIQGPGIGRDAAIIHPPPDEMLVVTSDPITFTAAQIGRLLLAVNINDVVTTGACPRWLLLDLLLPPGTTEGDVERFFTSIGEACREHEITLVGGHTEITDAVTRPVAVGTLVGTMKRDRRIDLSRARPGDRILLIGPIAVEGTAVLARERAAEVEKALGKEFRERAEALLEQPGICIREAALLAVSRYLSHALHDPTEGGLAMALYELAASTGCGVEVDARSVDVLPETEAICELFRIDPFGLLASGSLLAVLPGEEAHRLGEAVRDRLGLEATIIGALTEEKRARWTDPRGLSSPIPEFPRDEIARVLEGPLPPAAEAEKT